MLGLSTTTLFLGFLSLLSQQVVYAAQLSLEWPTHPEVGQQSSIQWSGGLPPVRYLFSSVCVLNDND